MLRASAMFNTDYDVRASAMFNTDYDVRALRLDTTLKDSAVFQLPGCARSYLAIHSKGTHIHSSSSYSSQLEANVSNQAEKKV
jgi:hypothetical protein